MRLNLQSRKKSRAAAPLRSKERRLIFCHVCMHSDNSAIKIPLSLELKQPEASGKGCAVNYVNPHTFKKRNGAALFSSALFLCVSDNLNYISQQPLSVWQRRWRVSFRGHKYKSVIVCHERECKWEAATDGAHSIFELLAALGEDWRGSLHHLVNDTATSLLDDPLRRKKNTRPFPQQPRLNEGWLRFGDVSSKMYKIIILKA